MERLKHFLEGVFFWRSLKNFLLRPFFLRSPEKFLWRPFYFYFWKALALVSLVLGLGLEHSCPWPREGLSSERLSLALASDFLCPWPRALCPRFHLCEVVLIHSIKSISSSISIPIKKQWKHKFWSSCNAFVPGRKVMVLQMYYYYCIVVRKNVVLI